MPRVQHSAERPVDAITLVLSALEKSNTLSVLPEAGQDVAVLRLGLVLVL